MDKKLFLFLDYDGTLTPIVKKPELAKLNSVQRDILKKLTKNKNILVAIVSGRGQKDVKSKVKIKNIHYIGNHGFEIDKYIHPKARTAKTTIHKVFIELKKKLKKIKGIIYEDKGYTASIHYRLVSIHAHGRDLRSDVDKIFEVFDEIVRPFIAQKKLKVSYGKKVIELRPPVKWNKGEAVKYLLKKYGRGYFPMYIGDDITDEDAFKVLKKKGLTICVGSRNDTHAEMRLSSVDAVYRFFDKIVSLDVQEFLKQRKSLS